MALTPGERLDLIKQLTADLADEEWGEIELTLDTFKADDLGPREGWGDDADYTRRRLRRSTDEVLVALHAHLHPDVSTGITPTAGGPWKEGYVKLFLTHTHPNKMLAKNVRERLLLYGIDAFVAHEMIEPTREWQEEIELALMTCEALAAILTADLIGSKYCDQEIGFVMGRGLVVIPVRQEADPHGFFGKYQGVPSGGDGPYAHWQIANGIFDALLKNPKTSGKMGHAVARRYCTSTSYDEARKNTAYLLDLPKEQWTDEMVDEVEKSGTENSQLVDGVWLPDNTPIPEVVSAHLDELLDRAGTRLKIDGSDFGIGVRSGGDDDIPF